VLLLGEGYRETTIVGTWPGAVKPRLVPGQLDFARSTQPSPHGMAAQLELPRSRSAAALNVHPRTPRATASLGPRLARNLARHSAGGRKVLARLVRDALIEEVAGDLAALGSLEPGILARAACHDFWTARVEVAPRRRVERARNLAGQHDLLALLVRVRGKRGGEERLRVGMLG